MKRFNGSILSNIISGPLSVVITPNNIIAKDGKSVTLNCTVIGFPVSKVTWKKNAINIVINNRIKLINDERTLHISPVKREDKGMFVSSNEKCSLLLSCILLLLFAIFSFESVSNQILCNSHQDFLFFVCVQIKNIFLPLLRVI